MPLGLAGFSRSPRSNELAPIGLIITTERRHSLTTEDSEFSYSLCKSLRESQFDPRFDTTFHDLSCARLSLPMYVGYLGPLISQPLWHQQCGELLMTVSELRSPRGSGQPVGSHTGQSSSMK